MKSYKSKICLPVLAFAFAGLMGCGSLHYPKAHHKEIDKNVHSFSYTADLRATHVIKKGDRYWILLNPHRMLHSHTMMKNPWILTSPSYQSEKEDRGKRA